MRNRKFFIESIWFSVLLLAGCEKQYKADDGYVHEIPEITVQKSKNISLFSWSQEKKFPSDVFKKMLIFLHGAKEDGIENIAISIFFPSAVSDEKKEKIKKQVWASAYEAGFIASRILDAGVFSSEDQDIKVYIDLLKYDLQEPDCSLWSEYIGDMDTNKDLPKFGAADRYNLKEMIANGADLVTPRKYKGPHTKNAINAIGTSTTSTGQ
ncbi:MAG: CpaD family pilus assembly lipoprotein [Holosporaceae bacterium]|jgi:pilus biogenesis lipoprotein CpaD|nr:CpaD family pilus assembly lipoprotein [Holosporaceae bacterium]